MIKVMFFETNLFRNLDNRLKINGSVEKCYGEMVVLKCLFNVAKMRVSIIIQCQ